MMNKKPNPYHRHRARRLLVQALYQWQMSQANIADIELQYLSNEENTKKLDIDYFREILHAIPGAIDTLEELLIPHLDRPLKNLDPIELTILRLGSYELTQRIDIPYKVVLNEALELAKIYGAEDSHKYINGILDKLAKQVRQLEVQADQ